MFTKEQKCPYCGAGLEAEPGMTHFFCKYCGGRIMVEDNSKGNIEFRKMEHAETMKQLDNAHDFRTMDHIEKIQAEANSQERFRVKQESRGGFRKGCLSVVLIVVLGFFASVTIMDIARRNRINNTSSSVSSYDEQQAKLRAAYEKENERLTAIERDVLDLVERGDYTNALVKANTIHFTAEEYLGVRGTEKKWDERREEIINSIYQVSGISTPTPIPAPKAVYMEGASENTTWPKGDIAKLIPIPASDDISIDWESETGFRLSVNDFSIEKFTEYCDKCWSMGFTKNYEKGENYFRAYNSERFYLSLSFRDSEMDVSLEKN